MTSESRYTIHSMSVLFEALQKANHEYRAQKTPVIVPLTRVSSTLSIVTPSRIIVVAALVLLLISAASAALYFLPMLSSLPDRVPKKDQAELSSRNDAQENNDAGREGISLPIESLNPDADLDGKAEAVMDSLADLAVVSGPLSSTQEDVGQGKSSSGIVVTRAPSRLSVALERARQAEAERAWTEALAYYSKALSIDAENIEAQQGKIYALGRRAFPRDIALLNEIVAENPDSAPTYIALAHSMVKRGQLTQALSYWKQALALDPENSDYQTGLGILYDKMGKHEQAIKSYRAVEPPVPASVRERLAFLQVLMEQQRKDESENGGGE
ncbi:MAG: tetratricopeptide repeat protein [Proteobacteria bacterium]|nr:tetratricopeptide repeat protein [Pseudomonadota bacterium]